MTQASTDASVIPTLLAGAEAEFDPYGERILEAARREFLEHGLRRTSLDEIARTAEVSRATLFRRFPNRDALVLALVAREAQGAIARVDARTAGIDDPTEVLVRSTLGVIEEISGNGLLQRLLVTDTEQVLPLLTTGGGPILELGREYIAGQLRRMVEHGAQLPDELDVVAELLARITLSLAVNREGVLPLDDEAAMARTVRSLTAPLVGSGGGRR